MTEPTWMARALALGFVDERGWPVPNRAVVERIDFETGDVTVQLVTPLRADFYTDDLERKPRPYRFDRTPDGKSVILPARWFVEIFETVRDDPARSATERAFAASALRGGRLADGGAPVERVILHQILRKDTGEIIDCEMLVPPATFTIRSPWLAGWPTPGGQHQGE